MSDFVQVQRKKRVPREKRLEAKHTPEALKAHYVRMVRSYKTARCCNSWENSLPLCPNGKRCFDAHTDRERRRDPLRGKLGELVYERGLCDSRADCLSGKNCTFAHNESESMYHPRIYKTKPCSHGDTCDRGDYCAFMHKEDVLTPQVRVELFLGGGEDEKAMSSSNEASSSSSQPSLPPPPQQQQQQQDQLSQQQKQNQERPSSPSMTHTMNQFKDLHLNENHSVETRNGNSSNSLVNANDRSLLSKGELANISATSTSSSNTSYSGIMQQVQAASQSPLQQQQEEAPKEQQALHQQGLPPMSISLETPSGSRSPLSNDHVPSSILTGQSSLPQIQLPLGQQRPFQLPQVNTPSFTQLDAGRVTSVSKVIQLLNPAEKLGSDIAYALLDLLCGCAEGRIGSDKLGNTALLHAVSGGHYNLVSELANPRTIDAPNAFGQTPLSIAVEGDDVNTLTKLVECGVSVNTGIGALNEGALILAIKRNSVNCAMFLAPLDSVDLSLMDANQNTALILAAEKGAVKLVQLLCAANPQVINARNANGETALFKSVMMGQVNVLYTLLQHKADPNITDSSNTSPLVLALLSENNEAISCVNLLLQIRGINVELRNNQGHDALTLAKSRNLMDVHSKLLVLSSSSSRGPFSSTVTVCPVCEERPPSVQANPCGHTVLCRLCVNKWFETLDTCPLCHNRVTSIV